MDLYKKRFADLTADELYRILQARCAVFIVEQKCSYQDLDGTDRQALQCGSKTKAKSSLICASLPHLISPIPYRSDAYSRLCAAKAWEPKSSKPASPSSRTSLQMFRRFDSKRSVTQ